MNIRAAEAMVSNAPKAMKIFPISEVWSQVEVSPVDASTGAAGVGFKWDGKGSRTGDAASGAPIATP